MTESEGKSEKESSEEEDSDSSGSNSDFSSDDDTSEVSDLDKFEEAFMEFRGLTDGVDPSLEHFSQTGQPRDASATPTNGVAQRYGHSHILRGGENALPSCPDC